MMTSQVTAGDFDLAQAKVAIDVDYALANSDSPGKENIDAKADISGMVLGIKHKQIRKNMVVK